MTGYAILQFVLWMKVSSEQRIVVSKFVARQPVQVTLAVIAADVVQEHDHLVIDDIILRDKVLHLIQLHHLPNAADPDGVLVVVPTF